MNYFGSFGSSESKSLLLLEQVLDKALNAHETGDYESYLSLITDELASKLSKPAFQRGVREIQPQLGKILRKTFLGSLKKGNDPLLVYSARYSNTDDDILIKVAFRNNSCPPKIEWLWIE